MKTIWLTGNDEEKLISVGEIVGEDLIKRDQNIELIVQSEVKEILGRGLKDTPEDKSTFADRLGFVGNLLHRNKAFAIIVSKDDSPSDRKKVEEIYGNFIDINVKDNETEKDCAKKIIYLLVSQGLISEQCQEIYSEEEEEEIRKRLEDLGYV